MPSSTKDPLLSLLHQYASLQPLHQLELPSSLVLARSQPWIVDHVLLNPQLVRYPPDKRYRKGFLKILVARLEEGCSEAAEEEELVSRRRNVIVQPARTRLTIALFIFRRPTGGAGAHLRRLSDFHAIDVDRRVRLQALINRLSNNGN